MPDSAVLPRARTVSRAVVAAAVVASSVATTAVAGADARGVSDRGRRSRQAMTLGVLALGMPHGAADTELLRDLGSSSRARHLGLLGAYVLSAVTVTTVVRSGSPWVDRVTLTASAVHFAEGELACWGDPPARHRLTRQAMRAVVAATTTTFLPAAVSRAQRGPATVGASGAVSGGLGPVDGERPAWVLLRTRGREPSQRPVLALTALSVLGTAALALSGDRRAAGDMAALTVLDVVAEPSLVFATYFGGWHSLRHTARVADVLVARGRLPVPGGLTAAVAMLARRSAWAAVLGVVGAGALAAAQPQRLTDNAFAAVLGLTAPHMVTVAAALARRRR